MYCRKKIYGNSRCINKVNRSNTSWYCDFHFERYNSYRDLEDIDKDIPYEEFLKEENYTKENPKKDYKPDTKDYLSEADLKKFLEEEARKEVEKSDLFNISKDKQNVHQNKVVNRTSKIASKLINTALADKETAKNITLSKVVKKLDLSTPASDNLKTYYNLENSICNLTAPTYRLTFNGLWMYISNQDKNSKKELYVRLEQELEENVGSCTQGNLARLTNVVEGYPGFEDVEYDEEPLMNVMHKLLKEPNVKLRLEKAKEILNKRNVSKEEYDSWLEALDQSE